MTTGALARLGAVTSAAVLADCALSSAAVAALDRLDAAAAAIAPATGLLGADHFEVAVTCANLAVLYADQGHFPDVEAAGRLAPHILESASGPATPRWA